MQGFHADAAQQVRVSRFGGTVTEDTASQYARGEPVGDEGEVCYALAVRDGGLRFTGMMGFLQRLLGA